MWFAESGSEGVASKIARIDPAGAVSEYPVDKGNTSPRGFATGHDGAFWLAQGFGFFQKIIRLTMAGATAEFPLPIGALPERITSGPDDAL